MKKIALSLILACGVAMAAEANATETKTEAATATKTEATKSAANGEALFKKCVSCHGAKAEKKALGKSEIIAGWDAAKVEEALKGYKAGTRNIHGMGGLMKGQVASYSDDDIKAVAEYISKLK